MKKSRSTRAESYKAQRDILLWVINKELKVNQVQISILCKKSGFKIDRTTIGDIIIEKDKQILQKKLE